MKIPGKEISEVLELYLKDKVNKLREKKIVPHLATILIGESAEQISYVTKKKQIAEKLGIKFDFIHLKDTPSFEKFIQTIKIYANDPQINGIIIQQPLPPQLQTDSIYNFIPANKEIEGHRAKSLFHPPISLATLTILKYIYLQQKIDSSILIDIISDMPHIKKALKHKKIVMVGKGITGGRPIGKTFNLFKINFISVNSQTLNPNEYYQQADIIISAVGKKVLSKNSIKAGAALINIGLRRENDKLKGDYDENEIKDIASFYTSTPGGIGPIDVLYLYCNLIMATELQNGIE